jgi:hypothetical protein
MVSRSQTYYAFNGAASCRQAAFGYQQPRLPNASRPHLPADAGYSIVLRRLKAARVMCAQRGRRNLAGVRRIRDWARARLGPGNCSSRVGIYQTALRRLLVLGDQPAVAWVGRPTLNERLISGAGKREHLGHRPIPGQQRRKGGNSHRSLAGRSGDSRGWPLLDLLRRGGCVPDRIPGHGDFAPADYGGGVAQYQLKGRTNEWWLDISGFANYVVGDPTTLTGAAVDIASALAKRFSWCALEGQDAVEADHIDGYANKSVTGVAGGGWGLTQAASAGFERWIAYTVHQGGMAWFDKNDPANGSAAVSNGADGYIVEECNAQWVSFQVSQAAGSTLSITVTNLAGPNAVLSEIFLGGGGTPPAWPSVATQAPQGSWVSAYGAGGLRLGGVEWRQ